MSKEMSEKDKELVEKFRKKILPLMQAAIDELEERAIEEGQDPQEVAKLECIRRKVRIERERSHD